METCDINGGNNLLLSSLIQTTCIANNLVIRKPVYCRTKITPKVPTLLVANVLLANVLLANELLVNALLANVLLANVLYHGPIQCFTLRMHNVGY